ncbi:MAG: hypothetical protein ACREVG_17225 [Burkholderiales bacterium]
MEDGNRLCNEPELVEGTQFDRSFPSPYFINSPNHVALVALGNQRKTGA